MKRYAYFCFWIFSFVFFTFSGCEKDITGINAKLDYKIAAVLDGIGDLSTFKSDGNEYEIIAGGKINQVVWSPVEAKLLYVKYSQNVSFPSALYEFDFNTNNSKLLINNTISSIVNPIYSQDGKKIFYQTNGTELVSMDSDGKNKEIIYTESGNKTFNHFGWTDQPEHLLIVARDNPDTSGMGRLFIINTRDKSKRFITDTEGDYFVNYDGNRWIFPIQSEDAIYMVDIQQNTISTIFKTQAWGIYGVTVSPDRQKILFNMQDSLSSVRKIYQIDPNGTNLQQLVSFEDESCSAIQFFPDGKRMLYLRRNINNSSDANFYVLDLNTRNSVNITQGRLTMYAGSYRVGISSVKF